MINENKGLNNIKIIKNNQQQPENLVILTKSNTIQNKTLNPKKIEKMEKMLNSRIIYLESLIEHKQLLKSSLSQKELLFKESNYNLKILIKQSHLLTTKNISSKEINFSNYNFVNSLTDDQQVKFKDNNLISQQNEFIKIKTEKRIDQLKDEINRKEQQQVYDSEIDITLTPFHERKITEGSILDESIFYMTTKKQDQYNEKWDISIIHTNNN